MHEEHLKWLLEDPRNFWTEAIGEELRYLDSLVQDVKRSREHEAMWQERGWSELVVEERRYRKRLMNQIKDQRVRVHKTKWQMQKKLNRQQPTS